MDEAAHEHVAFGLAAALAVHVDGDVRLTADVVVAVDTATGSHTTVQRRPHEDDQAIATARVERLVHTELARNCHPVSFLLL